jgi:hypothetical protein
MPAAELARLHTGSICDDDGPADEAAFNALEAVVAGASVEVMLDWHDPSGAFVMVSARP